MESLDLTVAAGKIDRDRRGQRVREVDPAPRPVRDSWSHGRAPSSSMARTSTVDRRRRSPGRWACCPRARSRRRASSSPTSSVVAGTRTSGHCIALDTTDDEAIAAALQATETIDLANRTVDELSGGQRQRVWIAMALAQETDVLLLDEPTSFLDVAHQIEVLDLLTDLNRTSGTTVVMVLHDLNLAARYADELVTVCDGRIHAIGPPADVITAELVREVFGLESEIIVDPLSGAPLVLPRGRYHSATAALPVDPRRPRHAGHARFVDTSVPAGTR